MDWRTLECPRCGNRDQFLVSAEKDSHLRRCSGCNRWFLLETAGDADDHEIDVLEHPPTCPVDACEQVLDPERLPEHIIETHDAELV